VDGSRSKPAGRGLDWLNAAPDADLRVVLGELATINQLRLRKLLTPESSR
jgi:hypothetical protein